MEEHVVITRMTLLRPRNSRHGKTEIPNPYTSVKVSNIELEEVLLQFIFN